MGIPPWNANSWAFTSPSSIITGSIKWGPGTFQHFRWSWTCTDFFLATSSSTVWSTSTVHCLMGGIWAIMAASVLRAPWTNNRLVPRISSCLGPSPQVDVSGFSKLLERVRLGLTYVQVTWGVRHEPGSSPRELPLWTTPSRCIPSKSVIICPSPSRSVALHEYVRAACSIQPTLLLGLCGVFKVGPILRNLLCKNGTVLLVCNFTPSLASKDQLRLFFFL